MMKRLPLCMALFVMIFGFCVNGFSAPPGWVDLKKKSQPLPTTVSPTAQPGGITAAPVSSGGQPPFPTILAVLPNTLTQGQTGSLMISGRDLHKDMRIKLGEGITTGSTTLLAEAGTNAMVPITVAPNASTGARWVQVQFRDRIEQSRIKVTVVTAGVPPTGDTFKLPDSIKIQKSPDASSLATRPSLSAMTVQAVTPNQWAKGKSYEITVQGTRFTEGMQVNFGNGIEIHNLKVHSAAKLTMTVKASTTALLGPCTLNARSLSTQPWSPFPAKAWIVDAPAWTNLKPNLKPKPKLVSHVPAVFIRGHIELLSPEDYLKSNEMVPEILNEQTLFSWREENPGMADWFEFRIVTENGYVIEKKRIDPIKFMFNGKEYNSLPTSLRMNTDYLLNLLTQRRQMGEHTFINGMAGLIVYWEVAGYQTKTITETVSTPGDKQDGFSKTKKPKRTELKNIEVAISDRWSLITPDKPTGMGCTGSGVATSAIAVINKDKGSRAASYPNDEWELTGKLNISRVPYAYHPSVNVPKPGSYHVYLPNVFLDWGDGSGAIPLEIDLSKPCLPDLMPLRSAHHHRYTRSGNFTVRIFVLPEGDIQQGPPNSLASAYDAVAGNLQASVGTVVQAQSATAYDPYYQVIKEIQQAEGSGYQFTDPSGPSFQFQENALFSLAGRAHLIYCETKTIEVREDLVARGPLNLESLAISGYNGSGSSTTVTLPSLDQRTIPMPNLNKNIPKTGSAPATNSSQTLGSSMPVMSMAVNNSNPSSPSAGAGLVQSPSGAMQGIINSMVKAKISACGILQGNGDLVYYGEGRAKITWSLNKGNTRMVVGSFEEALASPRRTEAGMVLTETTQNTPTPESYATSHLNSPVLDMNAEMISKVYDLVAEAEVLPQTNHLDQTQMINLLNNEKHLIQRSEKSSPEPTLFSWLVPEANAAPMASGGSPRVSDFKQSGVKMSVLAPTKEGLSGRPVTASLNHLAKAWAPPGVQLKKQKPYYVQSGPFSFLVQASDPDKPCKFVFPTSTGDAFEIYNLDVAKSGQNFTGTGALDMHLYTGQGGDAARFILPLGIGSWTIAGDGMTVISGNINLGLDYGINDAGMRMQLKKLAAQAGKTPMNLTLTAKPADTDLHLQGSTQAPEWTATAPLSSAGDWYFLENSTQTVAIGNSGFFIQPKKTVLDLSAKDGQAENPRNAGKEWAGLHFGDDAIIIPNLFDFQVPDANKGHVSNWGVEGTRLVGKTKLAAPFSTPYKKGTISFDSIDVDTEKNSLALYHNLDVHVPWLDTHLKGDVQLICGEAGKEAYFDYTKVARAEVIKTYKGITMTVQNLLFGNFQKTGWGAWSESTTYDFEAEKVAFASNIVVPGIIYSMDGRAFPESGNSVKIPLGGKSKLGFTPVDLVSLTVDFPGSGNGILSFEFTTNFSVSEMLPSVNVPIRYGLSLDGNQYKAEGPRITPFDIPVSFPAGQPRVEASIHVEYTGEGLSAQTAEESRENGWPLGVSLAHADAGPQDRFSGNVDMEMFGGPPVKAEFRLGYMGGHDYFLMRATIGLGSAGVPFVPPFLKLYAIRGGLGHNFPIDAFKSTTSLAAVNPVTDNSYIFMAGLRVGSSDGFICTMDGDLSIKTGEGARMDFRAWLLDSQPSGQGNFQGYFQYAAGGFDGMLSGRFAFLGDGIYFDIPENACTLHFGGNQPWHIYAGRDTGPKIRMHVLINDVDGYMMLDDTSLRIGGGIYYYLGASIGHISGTLNTGLTITPQPHVSGYAQGGIHAEVCAYDVCVGTGISVRVDLSALPISASARGCVEIPIPFWNPEVCATFSL
ncbi:MAG: hypothetical protein FP816_06280 [Desulfobacteraceae bacterium]|nr:hypothetical protein [Desulfobacteraceae bacterium]